jgi:DNA-directed RNA polymerase specialized sigma24 family protein
MRSPAPPPDTCKKILGRCPRPSFASAYSNGMERPTTIAPLPLVAEEPSRDVAAALGALSNAELLRLNALARLWTRGMPGTLSWADVLQEAIARALDGSRKWPPGVPILAFLSGVMRSICDDHWRQHVREARVIVRGTDIADALADNVSAANPDPERLVAAAQALSDIHQLFAGDYAALKIIAGLADGLTAAEICDTYKLSQREYDTTRKRMRRALLRADLDWS